jgi:DNA-binding XRE family transcriptional regulator
MNTTFKTPSGDEMVILPRAEYDRLVAAHDMSVDVAIYDRFYERLARGEEELIPSDIVDRLLDGENKVKVWRGHRGLTARELAEKTGLSASYISEIESGRKEGSISAMKKIAEVLGLDLDEVV